MEGNRTRGRLQLAKQEQKQQKYRQEVNRKRKKIMKGHKSAKQSSTCPRRNTTSKHTTEI